MKNCMAHLAVPAFCFEHGRPLINCTSVLKDDAERARTFLARFSKVGIGDPRSAEALLAQVRIEAKAFLAEESQ